jgi:hypothetical protein
MMDDGITGDQPRGDAAFVLVDAAHIDRHRAEAVLRAAGGHRLVEAHGIAYKFITGEARDDALERVRRRFGRTIADPFDGPRPLTE